MDNLLVCHGQWNGDHLATSIFERYILDAQYIKLVVELIGGFIVFVESMFAWEFWVYPLNISPTYLDSHYEEIDDDVCEIVRILSFHTIDEPGDH